MSPSTRGQKISNSLLCILVLWPARAEPLVLDPDSWPQSFPQGVAEVKPSKLKASITIASGPLSDSAAVSPQQQTLDFSKVPNAFLVQPGGKLTFSGLQLINLAAVWDYLYSTSQPYRSIARGRATWPSIGLAPSAMVSSLDHPTCSRCWNMRSSSCPAQSALPRHLVACLVAGLCQTASVVPQSTSSLPNLVAPCCLPSASSTRTRMYLQHVMSQHVPEPL